MGSRRRWRTTLPPSWKLNDSPRHSVTQLRSIRLTAPFFIQLVIDEGVNQGESSLLTLLLVGFGMIYALQAVSRMLRSWVTLCLGESLSFQLGGNVVRHLLRLPMGWYERRHVGAILSRVGSIGPIQPQLTKGVVDAAIDSTLLVLT